MQIILEKQYLRELKETHVNQMEKGKLNNAKKTLDLIYDCENRIKYLESFKKKTRPPEFILKEEKLESDSNPKRAYKTPLDKSLITDKSVLIEGYDFDYILYDNGSIFRCPIIYIDKIGRKYTKKGMFLSQFNNSGNTCCILLKKYHPFKVNLANLVYTRFKRKIPRGYYIIHVDGDVSNCDINNLRLKMRDKINPRKNKNKVA